MYSAIRRIHLIFGLILLVFVMMYFATGLPLIHEGWFHRADPVKTTRTETLAYRGDPGAEAFVTYLENTFGLRGKRDKPKQNKTGEWEFSWFRPGTEFRVKVSSDGKQATITKSEYNLRQIAVGLHRLHGYSGGWLYNIWAVLMDLASIATIVFGLSGIFLWYKLTRNRLPGWICLGFGCGLTAATIIHFLLHP